MPAPWHLGAQVQVRGLLHGQQTVNVLNFATETTESDITGPSPLLVALLTAVIECVVEALAGITSDWEFTSVEGKYIYNAGGSPFGTDPILMTPDPGSVGELSATSVSFAASLINLRTGQGGRSGRGKIFLPPPGESEVTSSAMSTGAYDALVAFATCMVTKFVGASGTSPFKLGVLSRKIAGATLTNFNAGFFEVTTITPVGRLAVLSRRKVGHGR